ncbi:MAG: DUF948 domain-containing protein [Thomasclavelia sp.]|nr:DUF948 domain-containing protein [Thomasclavelia sp.]
MEAMDICFCVLILSGAFCLVSLGVLLLRTSTTVKLTGKLVDRLQVTIDKVDKIIDDVNYKMDLLNAPVETISRFFDPSRPKFNPLGTILGILKNKKGSK